jgi:hypothetical protein
MRSKIKPPQSPLPEMDRVIQKIYDDLNNIVDNMNTDLGGEKEPDEKANNGSIAVSKDGNRYSLRGKTSDGWAKVNMTLIGSSATSKINKQELFTSSDNIVKLTDSTTGTISETLDDTTATQKDDVASLNAKLSTVIELANKQTSVINKLINKVNEIIRRIDE